MFSYIESFFSDPRAMLTLLLLSLPGRMLAISAHEAAHAWVADRCGDPTARLMGRVTLNPLKHLDVVGFLMMMIFGLGWAKPVPVNPLNYRNYRKDDLKVSIAGIAMNLILFLSGLILMYVILAVAIMQIPKISSYYSPLRPDLFIAPDAGLSTLFWQEGAQLYYTPLNDVFRYGADMSEYIIAPVFGQTLGYIYEMLSYFTTTNLCLAVFNLLPIPPLDGYHVLNDLVLKRPLFADIRAQRAGYMLLYLAMFSGILSDILNAAYNVVFSGVGMVASNIFHLLGLF